VPRSSRTNLPAGNAARHVRPGPARTVAAGGESDRPLWRRWAWRAPRRGRGTQSDRLGGFVRVIENVALRSRRFRRADHRFRRTHGSGLARIEQAPAPPLSGKQSFRGDTGRRLTVDAMEMRTFGEYEVSAQHGRDTCIDGTALITAHVELSGGPAALSTNRGERSSRCRRIAGTDMSDRDRSRDGRSIDAMATCPQAAKPASFQ
jgi:hypothetical protein